VPAYGEIRLQVLALLEGRLDAAPGETVWQRRSMTARPDEDNPEWTSDDFARARRI
jgi:hypothetical protein